MTVQVELFAQNLSAEEEEKVLQLQSAVSTTVQSSPAHQAFCTKGTYVRYLRARSWNIHKAARMLEDTLKWRASYKPEQLTYDFVEEEVKKGKVYILDQFDKAGRPVVFMRPRKEVYGGDNTKKLDYVVYVMERASQLADKHSPDGKMTWLLDYVGYNRQNQPPWKVSLQTLQIVQNHYPERLGRAVNFQPPFLFEVFWKAIRPFVDPVTRDKLVFLGKKDDTLGILSEHFGMSQLDETFGGKLPEDGMWDFDSNKERMVALDEEIQGRLALLGGSGVENDVEAVVAE